MIRYLKLGLILIHIITFSALAQIKSQTDITGDPIKTVQKAENYLSKEPSKALQLANQIINQLSAQQNSELYIRAIYIRASANSGLEKYKEALKDFLICQQHPYFIHDTALLAELKFKIGRGYDCISNINHAVTYYHEAMNLYLASNNLYGQAKVLQNMGIIESDRRKDSLAMQYYLKALDLYNILGSKTNQADMMLNIGIVYSNQGKDRLTIEYYNKALKLFTALKDWEGIASVENNLGLASERLHQYDKALQYYEKSIQGFKKINSKIGQAYNHDNLASLYRRLKKNEIAIQHYKLSLAYADSSQNLDFQAFVSKELASLYEETGNFEKSLHYFKNGSLLEDSVQTVESRKKIAEAEAQLHDRMKDIEIQKKEFQLHAEKRIKTFYLLGILALSLLLAGLIWAYYRKTVAENLIRKHREALEEEVQQRTQELKIEMFERKAAEEADKLKTAFLANMSHEIRTPMNAILSFSNFLKDPEISIAQRNEYANYINSCSISLLHLIDDILDTARIEAKQLKINFKPVLLNSLLNELFVYFQGHKKCQEGDIKIEVKTDCIARNYSVVTDAIRIRQVFTNLIDNAFKFTEKGTISFGFDLKDNHICFFVKDTGMGIPENKINLIFERFGQVHDTSQKIYKGTGLGLSISKNLIELLGGNIHVESIENKGSAFYFTIPAKDLQISELLPRTPDKKNQSNHLNDWKGYNILVAEDDDLNFKLINITLSKTKANIFHARNGEEVLDILHRQNNIHLILMDIQMPVMDGYETTQKVKQQYPEIRIIAQTAFAMNDDKEKCLQAGCDDYVSKPIELDEMLRKIGHYLLHTPQKSPANQN